jgi:hypothetical protein
MDENPFSLTGRTLKTGLIAVVLILVLLLSRWSPAAPILPGLALIGMGVVGLIPRGFTALVDAFDQEFADMIFRGAAPTGLVLLTASVVLFVVRSQRRRAARADRVPIATVEGAGAADVPAGTSPDERRVPSTGASGAE